MASAGASSSRLPAQPAPGGHIERGDDDPKATGPLRLEDCARPRSGRALNPCYFEFAQLLSEHANDKWESRHSRFWYVRDRLIGVAERWANYDSWDHELELIKGLPFLGKKLARPRDALPKAGSHAEHILISSLVSNGIEHEDGWNGLASAVRASFAAATFQANNSKHVLLKLGPLILDRRPMGRLPNLRATIGLTLADEYAQWRPGGKRKTWGYRPPELCEGTPWQALSSLICAVGLEAEEKILATEATRLNRPGVSIRENSPFSDRWR